QTSRFLEAITTKRNRRIMHQLHTLSRQIIELLKHEGMGTLVIGKNPFWKQEANMGKKNNQTFVQLPHARFIERLSYKAEAVGIRVILTEEAYTSQASFLDWDPLPTYHPQEGRTRKKNLTFLAPGPVGGTKSRGAHLCTRMSMAVTISAETCSRQRLTA